METGTYTHELQAYRIDTVVRQARIRKESGDMFSMPLNQKRTGNRPGDLFRAGEDNDHSFSSERPVGTKPPSKSARNSEEAIYSAPIHHKLKWW